MNLTARATTYLAGVGDATLADATAALAADIPADVLARTKARIERANGTCPNPAQRVIGDTLNRLVGKGAVEAAGTGDDRRFRLTPESRTVTARPKPRLEQIPLEHLTFDRSCQQRAAGLFDEATVERYVELVNEGVKFPPLEVVWEHKAGTNWVFGGFHRGEAFRRAGRNSCECYVYDGTKQDAVVYSLAENGNHPLGRTTVDVQRALSSAVLDKAILARILDRARDDGGVHRAIKAATGVSKGAIYQFLKAHGLKATRDGRLVKEKKPEADERSPKPPSTTVPTPKERTPDAEPDADSRGVPDHVRAALATRKQFDSLIAHLTESLRQLDAACSSNAAVWIRAVQSEGGEAVIREAHAVKGGVSSPVWTVPALVGLLRLLKRGRPSRVCAGCNGHGCRECRREGFLPESKAMLPTAGEPGDLFDAENVGDVWG